ILLKETQEATNLEDKEASENASQLSSKQWGSFSESPDLQIHFGLFQKGIIAVKPSFTSTPAKNLPSDDTQFHLNSRELIFGNSATTNSKKPVKLLNILGAFHDQPRLPNESQNVLIYNKTRRDEIFLPIVVEDEHKKKLGFYVYPWLSSNKDNFEFLGFKQFVIAGCIFGSSLKAIDDNNGTFALIKHDIKLYEKQKIVDIEVNLQEFSSYEKMLFSEFEKLMLLMKKFGKKHEEIELYYHLPYYDYILFGVELFVRGRITFPALDLFFNVIFRRKAQHEREIHRICKIHNILVRIESPFENIFGALPPNTTECAKFIFDKLRLSNVENKPELDEKLQKENEGKLVKHCLSQLTTNTYHEDHRQIWGNFLGAQKAEINNLEQLFKLANAAMIALACTGKKDYETCSLLPVSEKQIQLGFSDLNKQLNNKYPAVVNMTTLDPLITYDNVSKGLLFYFSACQQKALNKLITKEGILEKAHENISRYATQEKTESREISSTINQLTQQKQSI
nr:hypothetical protein [Gammaproteobacteria bacterium]